MNPVIFKGKRKDTGDWVEGVYGILGENTPHERHVIMVTEVDFERSLPWFYYVDYEVEKESVRLVEKESNEHPHLIKYVSGGSNYYHYMIGPEYLREDLTEKEVKLLEWSEQMIKSSRKGRSND